MSEPQVKVIKYQNEFNYFDIEKFQSSVFYYDLSAIMRRDGPAKILPLVDELMRKFQPAIVVVDTLRVLDDIISSSFDMREFLLDLSIKLAVWDCMALFIGEYTESEIMTRPESAIVDGIIYLSGTEEKRYQKRYMRVLKMRGTDYVNGEIHFKITNSGLSLFPRLNPDVTAQHYIRDFTTKISTGNAQLDKMLGGGIPESTITLISGGAGTGKTVMGATFAFNGLVNGESVLLITFEENPTQYLNSALSIGFDLKPYIDSGKLKLIHLSPIELDMDEHIYAIQSYIQTLTVTRLVIDSISAFELGLEDKIKYTDYMFSLTNFLKTMGVTALLTNELHSSMNVVEYTKHSISYIADNLVLLETKEEGSDVKRYIRIVKARSCNHDLSLKEFVITSDGFHLRNDAVEYGYECKQRGEKPFGVPALAAVFGKHGKGS
jgi:circadian clock protein KaiC